MQTLDTNCVLRWLVRDDPSATVRMDALVGAGRPLRVPDVAVLESVYVLQTHYGFSREEVARAIRLVLGQAVFQLDRTLWAGVMDDYVRYPKLSVTDIFLVVDAAHRGDVPVVTFDRKLISQMGAVAP
ncbi:MAG: PIN domain-containing protein [Propionibacteriaceae bacterium]|jgi:predicted nucleic-acid-binding protein|nr:PIN domain-containing protein [Propionibacteriaceae bacterium]